MFMRNDRIRQNRGMDITRPMPLLGGLSAQAFMRRHWQKKPLLIRQALPELAPWLDRKQLFALAARDDVESRLVQRERGRWSLRHGPLPRRSLPSLARRDWSLLVQGVDLHQPEAHELIARFRFVPDARLDDLMVSYASDGGGVGPHVDSYDVFLLQLHGRRRWRVAAGFDPTLLPNLPLKILSAFVAEQEWVLEPGDMLYLPPLWAHEGVALGECLTASIGFRAPARQALGHELLQRLLDDAEPGDADPLYRDRRQVATQTPGRIPAALQDFAADAVARCLADQRWLARALGEVLSEPKPEVSFERPDAIDARERGVRLDQRTRMMYDDSHVFINGESFRAAGSDARTMRQLADRRALSPRQVAGLAADARQLLGEWAQAGWLQFDAILS
jgi:50S ribosomal protein L16 3-hydroxylase